MEILFHKPCHETAGRYWINLDVRKVKEARKRKEMITVILPEGRCKPVDPRALLKYGVKTEAVYLYPDNPMRLVGSYFSLMTPEEIAKEEAKKYFG